MIFQLNGTPYSFPGPGNGNVIGPNSVASNDIAIFNGNSPTTIQGMSNTAAVTTFGKDTDNHVEFDKTPSPTNWFGNAWAGPMAVFQFLQDQNITTNSAPGLIFQDNITGSGTVSLPNTSSSFWPGLEVIQTKQGDGSGQAFTCTSQLQAVGGTGYNEGSCFDGMYTNVGSTNGYLSGVEVGVFDSINGGVTTWKTRLHGVIGRVGKYDTTFPSTDSFNSNSFMATSEGSHAVGSALYLYDIGGHGWDYGIDMSAAHIASGAALVMPNLGGIETVNATSSAIVPLLAADPSDNTYIRPAATGAHTYLTDFSGNPDLDLNPAGVQLTSNVKFTVTAPNTTDIAHFNNTGAFAATVYVNDAAGGQQALIEFQDASTNAWQIGKQTDNSFYAFDVANSANFMTVNSGVLKLGESGKNMQAIGALVLTAAAPTVASNQVGIGSVVSASSNCGSLSGAAGCLNINVNGTAHYVPYY